VMGAWWAKGAKVVGLSTRTWLELGICTACTHHAHRVHVQAMLHARAPLELGREGRDAAKEARGDCGDERVAQLPAVLVGRRLACEEDVRERALKPPLRALPRLSLDQQRIHLAHLVRVRVGVRVWPSSNNRGCTPLLTLTESE
jgi:hypothetical protein